MNRYQLCRQITIHYSFPIESKLWEIMINDHPYSFNALGTCDLIPKNLTAIAFCDIHAILLKMS